MKNGENRNPTKALLKAVIVIALLLGSVAATCSQSAGDEDCKYFAESDHRVCGKFLEFFNTRGGLEIFGYPLTEAFDDPSRGLRVQYFQRCRMEWHTYNAAPYDVQLGLLIDELGYSFPPAEPEQIPAYNNSLHYYFPETDHIVSYAFLQFFKEKGGLDILGYPRSEFMYEDGYIVQYFQRARVEWHPEAEEGSQMRLTDIGERYIEHFPLPEESAIQQFTDPVVTGLDASASVRYATMGREGTQTVFVYVSDQRRDAVQGAAVAIAVRHPTDPQTYTCDSTNASGFTRCSFEVNALPPGERILVDVTVSYGDLTATTQTFFIPWW
jgi:hypothetical protein